MARNIVQDVVPGRRSIRDVSLPSRRRDGASPSPEGREVRLNKKAPEVTEPPEITPPPPDYSNYDTDYNIDRPRKGRKIGLWSLIIVFILALAFGISFLFSSASVSVIAKTQTLPVTSTLSAPKNPPAGQFGYQIVSISGTAQEDVPAGAESTVNKKASGTIVVYNASDTLQNLRATTRFQTPAGLIFRTTTAISVPKASTVSGQSVPGSVTVNVIADAAGDTYNVGLSDFTLPGLAGTPQFKTVYGRSKTSMSGGFSGTMKTVASSTMAQAKTDLQKTLQTNLQTQIAAGIPSGYILYPQSLAYTYGDVSQKVGTSTTGATVTEDGTVSAVIFDKALLSQAILGTVTAQLANQGQAEVKNLDGLTFALKQPATLTKDYTGPISFTLTGDAQVTWLFDQTALKNDLIGLNKNNLNGLLEAKYPSIDQAQAKIFPVWKQSFPSDPSKITITQVDAF